MKTKLIVLLFIIISITTFGQRGSNFKDKKEQIKALKVAFITTELNLTSDEAAKFWPVFNAFDDKQHEIRKQKFKNLINNNSTNLTEKEATTILIQMESDEEDLYLLRKKFMFSLKNILPATKILKLKKAEEEFSKKLLKQYRDKKNDK